ncbi:MAG: N-acetyl-gamma-glutamyl-phosphate reductase [Woeseia sp.]
MTAGPGEISAVVIGATGYVGGELLRLLSQHPDFSLHAAVSESQGGVAIGAVFPHLAGACAGRTFAKGGAWTERLDRRTNLALFSAAPNGASAPVIADALEAAAKRDLAVHVVDCSADFRYADAEQYREIYRSEHAAPRLLDDFFCAVPEHAPVVNAEHVGHPGCFATAVLLAAVPLVASQLAAGPLFVSAVTGSTGSGRTAQPGTHHPERHSNLYAYKPLSHRHAPEIERLVELAGGKRISIHFVPHSGPFSRGIYATLQAELEPGIPAEAVREAFRSYYAGAQFVRVVDGPPKLKDVVASNYCHIGIEAGNDSVVVMSAIDNLIKGAAGGAVQWMNRLWSLPETTGLLAPAAAWT